MLLQKDEDASESEMNFLNGAHARPQTVNEDDSGEVDAAAANLQSFWGQQIAFSAIVKSGALVKKADGNYGQGGGFTMGEHLKEYRPICHEMS